jgi:hypothetical protein
MSKYYYYNDEIREINWIDWGKPTRCENKSVIIWHDETEEWWKNQYFDLDYLFLIQNFIKLVFHFKCNKFVWSPNNLAGKFTKSRLLAMLLARLALS